MTCPEGKGDTQGVAGLPAQVNDNPQGKMNLIFILNPMRYNNTYNQQTREGEQNR
ncbi:hypothetical protein [Desulfolithobacter sp.]